LLLLCHERGTASRAFPANSRRPFIAPADEHAKFAARPRISDAEFPMSDTSGARATRGAGVSADARARDVGADVASRVAAGPDAPSQNEKAPAARPGLCLAISASFRSSSRTRLDLK
jgi:hypothetical protein